MPKKLSTMGEAEIDHLRAPAEVTSDIYFYAVYFASLLVNLCTVIITILERTCRGV